jgi:uncharacterized protein with FMN-binding domain
MKKYIIVAVIVIVVAACILGIKYLKSVYDYKEKVKNIVINDVNLENKEDGEYFGEFDVDFIAAKVEVDIKDKKISNIKLIEHKNERGAKAEVIPERVVRAQSLKVDAVSGATNSSKVILKAIQNALDK